MDESRIEKSLECIRNEIRTNGYKDNSISFGEIENDESMVYRYSDKDYLKILHDIESRKNVALYRELEGGTITRFIKKIVRKMVAFLGVPIVTEQSLFNSSVESEFEQIAAYINFQNEELYRCRQDISLLLDKIVELQNDLKKENDS